MNDSIFNRTVAVTAIQENLRHPHGTYDSGPEDSRGHFFSLMTRDCDSGGVVRSLNNDVIL